MQTWQIMMGLGVLADMACLGSIVWFWLRKDDGFDYGEDIDIPVDSMKEKEETEK